jgi:hypothetical protein
MADAKATRRSAIESLEKVRLRLLTAATAFAAASEVATQGVFDLTGEALQAPPRRVLQDGVVLGVNAYGALNTAAGEACRALTEPYPPGPPRPAIIGGVLTFFIDQFSQATDPFRSDISIANTVTAQVMQRVQPAQSRLTRRDIPGTHVGFSRSADHGGTYLVSLAGLGNLLWGSEDGDYEGALVWAGKRLPVRVVFRRST